MHARRDVIAGCSQGIVAEYVYWSDRELLPLQSLVHEKRCSQTERCKKGGKESRSRSFLGCSQRHHRRQAACKKNKRVRRSPANAKGVERWPRAHKSVYSHKHVRTKKNPEEYYL